MSDFKVGCILLALPFAIAFICFIPFMLYGVWSSGGGIALVCTILAMSFAFYVGWKL